MTSSSGIGRSKILLASLIAGLAIVASGCSSSSGGTTDARANSSTPSTSGALGQQIALITAGTFKAPVGEAPKPTAGKKVWIISCGQASISCSIPSNAAKEAATTAGWDATLFDGNFDPAQYQAGIRQAVAAGADGILLFSIDCNLVTSALAEATTAGVDVADIYGIGCEPLRGPHFTTESWAGGFTTEQAYEAYGRDKAAWITHSVGGTGTVLDLQNSEFPLFEAIDRGFSAGMAEYCPACKVVKIPFSTADEGPGITQKLDQALLRNPEAVALQVPYDGLVLAGVDVAVRAWTGKSLEVMGSEAYPPNVKLIQDGTVQTSALATATEGAGWVLADELNSLFAGMPQREYGLGWQVVAKGANLPPQGSLYTTPVDYKALIKQSWGK